MTKREILGDFGLFGEIWGWKKEGQKEEMW